MSDTPDALPDHPQLRGAKLLAGPRRRGNELGWQLELADGRRARLAQLTRELSDDGASAPQGGLLGCFACRVNKILLRCVQLGSAQPVQNRIVVFTFIR